MENAPTPNTAGATPNHAKSDHDTWEIEILISGGALFTLYQLSTALIDQTHRLLENAPVVALIAAMTVGLRMLSIFFGIHLCIRTFWLSLVLFRKVYPGGINREKLGLAEPFRSIASGYDLGDRVRSADTLASQTFAWSVAFATMLIGIGLGIGLLMLPFFIMSRLEPSAEDSLIWNVLDTVVDVTILIYLFDAISFGILRRSKITARIYYPIYMFWNAVTLGFLWRPGFQIIYSNSKSKWKTFLVALIVSSVAAFFSADKENITRLFEIKMNFSEEMAGNEIRYFDKRINNLPAGSFIQSDVVTDGFLRVYVSLTPADVVHLKDLPQRTRFSQEVKLHIDDSTYAGLDWIDLDRANGERGIQTVIDISGLKKALHVVKIQKPDSTLVIPFWKQ